MRETSWTDEDGRLWRVLLPEGVPDSEARKGVVIGPASLEKLDLPLEIEVRLHNQLYSRRIFSEIDARKHRKDVLAALMGAMKVHAERIIELYADSN